MDALDPHWFSKDYATARSRFRALVTEGGGETLALPIDAKGPNGDDLTIDIGWFGAREPKRALLHISGTHGVEGFAGSSIQLAAIASGDLAPGPDEAVVFVHALNPYGMAWIRRVNENNVDLNRNFLPPDMPYEGVSDGYKTMNSTLNPPSAPRFDFYLLRSVYRIVRHGYNTLKQAVTEGQYGYPKGLFFGGQQLEEAPRLYSQFLTDRLSMVEELVAIDIHSGLGKSGEDTLLIDAKRDDPLYLSLHASFGDRVAPWDASTSIAYEISGGHPAAVCRILHKSKVEFITQEFGTIPGLKVLFALRQENRWHHWGDGHLDHPAKEGLLHAFRPDTPAWKKSVLARGRQVLLQSARRVFRAPDNSAASVK
jgi:hypothetical protein